MRELDKLYKDRYFKRRVNRYDEKEKKIAEILYKIYKPSSVLDVGCGIGSYLCKFKEIGCNVVGIDKYMNKAIKYVDESIKEYMNHMDCGKMFSLDTKFDLVMCIEVAEHILPQNSETLINNLSKHAKNRVLLSVAEPGQRGTGHINCQPKRFWLDLCNKNGLFLEKKETEEFCNYLYKKSPIPKNNVLIFSLIN